MRSELEVATDDAWRRYRLSSARSDLGKLAAHLFDGRGLLMGGDGSTFDNALRWRRVGRRERRPQTWENGRGGLDRLSSAGSAA